MKKSRLEDMSGSSVEQSRLLDCRPQMKKSICVADLPVSCESGLGAQTSADNKSLGNVSFKNQSLGYRLEY